MRIFLFLSLLPPCRASGSSSKVHIFLRRPLKFVKKMRDFIIFLWPSQNTWTLSEKGYLLSSSRKYSKMFEHFGVDFRAIVWVDFLNDFLANFCQFFIVFWMFWINLDFELRWVLRKLLLQLYRAATACKAPKAWALPRFWVSICSYKKQPVKKFGVEYWALPDSNLPWRPNPS